MRRNVVYFLMIQEDRFRLQSVHLEGCPAGFFRKRGGPQVIARPFFFLRIQNLVKLLFRFTQTNEIITDVFL